MSTTPSANFCVTVKSQTYPFTCKYKVIGKDVCYPDNNAIISAAALALKNAGVKCKTGHSSMYADIDTLTIEGTDLKKQSLLVNCVVSVVPMSAQEESYYRMMESIPPWLCDELEKFIEDIVPGSSFSVKSEILAHFVNGPLNAIKCNTR